MVHPTQPLIFPRVYVKIKKFCQKRFIRNWKRRCCHTSNSSGVQRSHKFLADSGQPPEEDAITGHGVDDSGEREHCTKQRCGQAHKSAHSEGKFFKVSILCHSVNSCLFDHLRDQGCCPIHARPHEGSGQGCRGVLQVVRSHQGQRRRDADVGQTDDCQ